MAGQSKFSNAQLIEAFFCLSVDAIRKIVKQKVDDAKKRNAVLEEIHFFCKFCPEGEDAKKVANVKSIANLAAHAKTHSDCDEIVNNVMKVYDDSQPRINSAFKSSISEEAREMYQWADYIIMSYSAFATVEDPLARKYFKMQRHVGTKYFMEVLQSLGDEVCKVITKALPEVFGVIFDGWTAPGVSEHYVAFFFTYWNGSKVERIFVSMAPMQKPENEDETHFGAVAHVEHLKAVLAMYGKSLDNVSFLVGDNCSVNKKFAKLLKIPLVGCALHRLNLAVEKLFETEKIADLLKIVKTFMQGLKSLKNTAIMRQYLHEDDYLTPLFPNATRWLSTFMMLERFLILYQLVLGLPLVDVEFPTPNVYSDAKELRDKLVRVHSTMIAAQSDDDSNDLALIRALFDQLEPYIGADSDIIYDKDFENAVCKVQNCLEVSLTAKETAALIRFEKEVEVPGRQRRTTALTTVEFIEEETKKRRRLENAQSGTKYNSTKHIAPHSCCVERLFSRAKLVFSDHRRRMLPRNLELALYLHQNRALWSIATVQDSIIARRRGANVPIVEQATQPAPTVDLINDSDSEDSNE